MTLTIPEKFQIRTAQKEFNSEHDATKPVQIVCEAVEMTHYFIPGEAKPVISEVR